MCQIWKPKPDLKQFQQTRNGVHLSAQLVIAHRMHYTSDVEQWVWLHLYPLDRGVDYFSLFCGSSEVFEELASLGARRLTDLGELVS